MNIHEHQAKQILKKYGVVVPKGVFAFTVDELIEKAKSLKTEKFVLKAQIHAGGRGKAGGVKILNNIFISPVLRNFIENTQQDIF
jgi:succinyl-CoA synthetase beta subunit